MRVNKIDSLLEKAKIFEKLATFDGDRKSFLKSLGQFDMTPAEGLFRDPVDTNIISATGLPEEKLNQRFRNIVNDLKMAGIKLPGINPNPTSVDLEKEIEKLITFLRQNELENLSSKENNIKELYEVYNELQKLPKEKNTQNLSSAPSSVAGKDLETLNNMKFWVEKLRGMHDVTDRAKMNKIINDVSAVLNRMKKSYPKQAGELLAAVERQRQRIQDSSGLIQTPPKDL
jgi:hypothetical protein